MNREFGSFESISLIGQGKAFGEIEYLNHLGYRNEVYKKGGFASIHQVVSVNGNQRDDLLLKKYDQDEHAEHAYKAIEQLHIRLKRLQLKNGVSTYQKYPMLKGLPFLVFKSIDELTDEVNVGLLMFDLTKLGYKDFGDDETRNELVAGAIDSVLFSYQLAKVISLLHGLNFFHADLKAASIFINPVSRMISLIDYDSGFHSEIQAKPTTVGTPTGWQRILSLIGMAKDSQADDRKVKYIHNDIWAMNAAIFQFFAGQNSPYSFLTTLDDSQREEYIRKIGWPNFESNSKLFNENAESLINDIQAALQFLEEELEVVGLRELFKKSFNQGYWDYNQIGKPSDWIALLGPIVGQLRSEPDVLVVAADKNQIQHSNEVISFRWEANHCDYVTVGGVVSFIDRDELEIPIAKEMSVEIKFFNFYTYAIRSIFIKAISKFPEIEYFNADTSIRTDESPVILSWKLSGAYRVSINGVRGLNLSEGEMLVRPILPTTFKLLCEGGFGEISEAEVFVDIVRPEIKEFSYEINLDHGLDNVDLKWKVTDAVSVEISPVIGAVPFEGVSHVQIKDEKEFTLAAKGMFSSDFKVIKAKPFPLPVIRELMVTFPKIDLNARINLIPLRVPDPMYRYNQIKFQNGVDVLPNEIKYFDGRIEFNLDMPALGSSGLEGEDIVIPRKWTFKHLFDKVSHYLKKQTNG